MARLIALKGKSDGQRVVLMGGPKTGKTALISQLATKYELLYWDLENGKDTLIACCSDAQLDNIEYIKLPDSYNNAVAVKTLLNAYCQGTGIGYVCADHGAWKCPKCVTKTDTNIQIDLNKMKAGDGWIHVIDSATQFALSQLHNLCVVNGIKREDAVIGEKENKVTLGLWDGVGAAIDRLFSTFQASDFHLCVTAHELEVEMPDKSKKLVPYVGTKKYAHNFGKYFSAVIRLSLTNKKHKVESTTTSSVNANVGGRRTIDLSKPGTSLTDFFDPVAEIQDKIQKFEVSVLKPGATTKPVIPAAKPQVGISTPQTNSPATTPVNPLLAKLQKPV